MKKIIFLFLFFTVATPVYAQRDISDDTTNSVEEQSIRTSMEQGPDVTYEQILADPDNLSLNMRYAQTQIRNGDIKGASGTLERMMILMPDNMNIKLLYAAVLYRLDDIPEAKTVLDGINENRMSAQKISEKRTLENLIRRREKKYTLVSRTALGVAYDTNRNAFPDSSQIVYPSGGILKLNGGKEDDFSMLGMFSADYELKAGKSGKNSFFLGGSYYISRQDTANNLNMDILSGKTGFRFNGQKTAVIPQIVYSALWLDGHSYINTAGISLRTDRMVDSKNTVYAEGRLQKQDYINYLDNTGNNDRDGLITTASLGWKTIPASNMSLDSAFLYTGRNAEKKYYASDAFGGYINHFWLLGRKKYLISSLSFSEEKYRDVNVLESDFLGSSRTDQIFRGSLNLGLPLPEKLVGRNISFNLSYEYFHNHSSMKIYSYTNNKITGILTCRFEI